MDRYERNAPGSFYVIKDACIICMAPEHEAPTLMGFFEDSAGSERSYCYFKKQPSTPKETRQAIQALRIACCASLRYAGDDPKILDKLAGLGLAHLCDKGPASSLEA